MLRSASRWSSFPVCLSAGFGPFRRAPSRFHKFLHVALLRRERLKAICRRSLSEVYSLAHHLFAASPLLRLVKRYGKGSGFICDGDLSRATAPRKTLSSDHE